MPTPVKWARGSIAGISLLESSIPTRCYILNAATIQPRRYVNNRTAADGTIYQQGFNTHGRNAKFGVRFDYLPLDLFNSIISAINGFVDTPASFNVNLTDDFQTVNTSCTVDGSDWLQYPEQLTNLTTVKQVVMRFVTT